MDSLTWATVALAVSTFLLVIWTILGERIVRSYRQPKLLLEVEMKHPDCIKIKAVKHDQNMKEVAFCDAYYVRFRIFNKGKDPAMNVDAFLELVEKENGDGEYLPVETHIPLHLNWSNRQDLESIYVPRINGGQYRYWDLFHILDPQHRSILPGESPHPDDKTTTVINVDTYLKPTSFSYLLEPGTFHMRVVASASNSKPTETIFQVKCDGKWYPQEYEMLGNGLAVKILEQKVGS